MMRLRTRCGERPVYRPVCRAKWHAGDMVKIPKFLGKAGREKKAEKGRPVDGGTLFKWNHIGSVAKPMLQVPCAKRHPRTTDLGSQ